MVGRGLAPKTVRTDYGVLRAIFSWAFETDLVERSPCRGIRLPEMSHQARALVSADGVERLADAMPADFRAAVFVGALGLRQGEVFGLRVGAVDFLRRSLTVRATLNEVDGRFVEGTGKTSRRAAPSPSPTASSRNCPPTWPAPDGPTRPTWSSRHPKADRCAPLTSAKASTTPPCESPASTASLSTCKRDVRVTSEQGRSR
jgi:hypothetical protein